MKTKSNFSKFTACLIAAIVIVSVIVSSCGKKEEEHDLEITMTYAPNPALKDSVITITFTVKDMGELTSVMGYSCEINSSATVMPLTETSAGVYTGTHTFTATGANNLLFKYMHDDEDGSSTSALTVQ